MPIDCEAEFDVDVAAREHRRLVDLERKTTTFFPLRGGRASHVRHRELQCLNTFAQEIKRRTTSKSSRTTIPKGISCAVAEQELTS